MLYEVITSLNMFTLIGIGTGVAYLYSLVASLFPQAFPAAFRGHEGNVAVYFEAAAVIITLVLVITSYSIHYTKLYDFEASLAAYQVGDVDFLNLLDSLMTLYRYEIDFHREMPSLLQHEVEHERSRNNFV